MGHPLEHHDMCRALCHRVQAAKGLRGLDNSLDIVETTTNLGEISNY
jgi:hypothetical protein